MRCPPALDNEEGRLKALDRYTLKSDCPLPSLDSIVSLASSLFDCPAAAVNMIGNDHVFFAACTGIDECDMSRDVSFCAHALAQDDVLVIEDALFDERFHDNPLVTAPGGVRFYAGAPIHSPDGHALGVMCIIDPMPRSHFSSLDRKRLQELARLVFEKLELRRLEIASMVGPTRFENVAQKSPNGIICLDEQGIITSANPAAGEIFGGDCAELIGMELELILPDWRNSRPDESLNDLDQAQTGTTNRRVDIVARKFDESETVLEVGWSRWVEGDEIILGAIIRDVAAQRREEQALRQLAKFDEATGLVKRTTFLERLREIVSQDEPAAVLAVGLIGFEDIDDTFGHDFGDVLLKQAAERLTSCIRPVDIAARVGNDEFKILLSGIGDPTRSNTVAKAVTAAMTQPFSVKGREVRILARCGIALSSVHGSSSDELVGNSRLALQEAIRRGDDSPFLFVSALRMQAIARREFESELHRALEHDEFEIYYQPQVRLSDGALTGAEALIRWNHPERGLLAPAAFLTVLEDSSLAPSVGNWVVDQACKQTAQWRTQLTSDFRMSINLFASQIRTGDLRNLLMHSIDRYGLTGEAIELEITENIALDNDGLFIPLLHNLKSEGILLAFDDFGTGFASLSMLQKYPLNHLKIDKSFIQKACEHEHERAIVEAITALAHRLGLKVIAEGIENLSQLEFCTQIGCDEAQGYLIGKPMPAEEFLSLALDWPDRKFAVRQTPGGKHLRIASIYGRAQ